MFEDREALRLERRLAKDRARMEAREERHPRDGQQRDDDDSQNEDDVPAPSYVKPKKSKPVHYKTKVRFNSFYKNFVLESGILDLLQLIS